MQTNSSSNQVKPDEFRVGDTVWCLIYGKGKVAFISESSDGYDVGVNFDNSGISAYTKMDDTPHLLTAPSSSQNQRLKQA